MKYSFCFSKPCCILAEMLETLVKVPQEKLTFTVTEGNSSENLIYLVIFYSWETHTETSEEESFGSEGTARENKLAKFLVQSFICKNVSLYNTGVPKDTKGKKK